MNKVNENKDENKKSNNNTKSTIYINGSYLGKARKDGLAKCAEWRIRNVNHFKHLEE